MLGNSRVRANGGGSMVEFSKGITGKIPSGWFCARPRPVRPEDCAMEVEKPAARALCSGQRRLVELSTTEDKVEEGASTGIGAFSALALAYLSRKTGPVQRKAPASPPDSPCQCNSDSDSIPFDSIPLESQPANAQANFSNLTLLSQQS